MCLTCVLHFGSIIYPFCPWLSCWKLFRQLKKNSGQRGSLAFTLPPALSGFVQVSFYMRADHIIMQLRNHLNRHHTNFTMWEHTPLTRLVWLLFLLLFSFAFDVTMEQSAVAQVAQARRRRGQGKLLLLLAHSHCHKQQKIQKIAKNCCIF